MLKSDKNIQQNSFFSYKACLWIIGILWICDLFWGTMMRPTVESLSESIRRVSDMHIVIILGGFIVAALPAFIPFRKMSYKQKYIRMALLFILIVTYILVWVNTFIVSYIFLRVSPGSMITP